jgi:hypothetical protein
MIFWWRLLVCARDAGRDRGGASIVAYIANAENEKGRTENDRSKRRQSEYDKFVEICMRRTALPHLLKKCCPTYRPHLAFAIHFTMLRHLLLLLLMTRQSFA